MPDNPGNREDAIRSSITRSAMDAILARGKEPPTHGLALYLTPEVMQKSNELFDRAERLADNERIRERVKIARMPLRFAEFSMMKNATRSAWKKSTASFRIAPIWHFLSSARKRFYILIFLRDTNRVYLNPSRTE